MSHSKIRILFSGEEIDHCIQFSQDVDTSFYSTRNQNNNSKRQKDSLIGKLGEVAVYNYLKDKIVDLSEPDFKIYGPKEKSWDFDLKGQDFNLHIKSQDIQMGTRFGTSWIFQCQGFSYDKEIFDRISPNQYIAFVSISLIEKFADIQAIVKLDFLHDNSLFEDPKVWQLRGIKKAVYLEKLLQCNPPILYG